MHGYVEVASSNSDHEATKLKPQLCQDFFSFLGQFWFRLSVFSQNSTVVIAWHHCESCSWPLNVQVKLDLYMLCHRS